MKHFHLFEMEDQQWLPATLRNMITQITQFSLEFFKIYDEIVPKIERLLQITGETHIIDLCSGSSGPWPRIIAKFGLPVTVTLTDKYPNLKLWKTLAENSHGKIDYIRTPIDALQIPGELKGLRTIFTGFHHFKPEEATKILNNTIAQNQAIAIFEFTERNLPAMLRGLWLFLLVPFIETPFIRPFTLARFFWTYLIPIIPIFHWWDGLVSNLRTYSLEDLKHLVNSVDSNEYTWEVGIETIKTYNMKVQLSYLIGYHSV